MKKKLISFSCACLIAFSLEAQIASSFELRYHSKEKEARGITDFKGENELTPVILNVGEARNVRLKILVKTTDGNVVETREYQDLKLEKGRSVKELSPFRPKFPEEGYYVIEYYVLSA